MDSSDLDLPRLASAGGSSAGLSGLASLNGSTGALSTGGEGHGLSASSSQASFLSEDDDFQTAAERFADTSAAILSSNACIQQLEAAMCTSLALLLCYLWWCVGCSLIDSFSRAPDPGVESRFASWLSEQTDASAVEQILTRELKLSQEQVVALRKHRENVRGVPAQVGSSQFTLLPHAHPRSCCFSWRRRTG
jgi:hypothetical protein